MYSFVDISDDQIININTKIVGTKTCINTAFTGYKASLNYIDNIEEQIAAAVVSIARNHSFKDGNKRTAVVVYYILCDLNNITPKDNIQDIILNIVKNHMEYKQATEVLFDMKQNINKSEEVEESVEDKASEEHNEYNLDTIVRIITEESNVTIQYLYDLTDALNIAGNELYPEQVDQLLSQIDFNPETLDRIEKRIIEEADIEKNKKDSEVNDIKDDIDTLKSLLDPDHNIKLFSQKVIEGLAELIKQLEGDLA